jgi:hypothetical protein
MTTQRAFFVRRTAQVLIAFPPASLQEAIEGKENLREKTSSSSPPGCPVGHAPGILWAISEVLIL